MLKTGISHKKIVFIVAAAFLLSAAAGITISQNDKTFAAASSIVGSVDFQLLMDQHPDTAVAQQTMQAAIAQTKQEFETKGATMNEQDKKDLYTKLQQQLAAKQQTLLDPIKDKVLAAVKAVAEAKGMTIVIDKGAVIYDSQDITAEVGKKMTGH